MKILKIAFGLLLLLIILFFGVGLLVPSFTYENRVSIDRPVDQVWTVFTDESKLGDWLQGFQKVEILEGKPLTAGSRFKLTFIQDGETIQVIEEVTKVEPNRTYVFDMDTDPFLGTTEVTFNDHDGVTEMVSTSTVNGKNILWRALLRVSKSMLVKNAQDSYDAFKKLAES